MTAAAEPVQVVYICSHTRSGSTLVGSVLGLCAGHCYVGEVRDVWRDGLKHNDNCGCGKPFRDCPFWTEVFARAFGGMDAPEALEARRLFAGLERLPVKLGLFRLVRNPAACVADFERYRTATAKLYRAIRDVSSASVIVDSSKTLRYGALLRATPDLTLRVVNLIRDPRGIVYSRARKARYRDGTAKPASDRVSGRYRILRILAKWVCRNSLCGWVMARDGGIRVKFEDFLQDQAPLVAAVAGESEAARVGSLLAEGVPEGMVQHQVAGNWVRGLSIKTREAWHEGLPKPIQFWVGRLSAPFVRSQGLEIFPSPITTTHTATRSPPRQPDAMPL